MSSVNRRGVEFDMCPTCRGVWLDRGELEKLMAAAEDEARAAAPPPQAQAPSPAPRRYDHDDHPRRERWDDDDYRRYPKKKKFDLFDIFD
jgi:hypothetical protein